MLDYETIRRMIGLEFSVAASAQQGETYTCLIQQRGTSLPDLALSVSATVADEKTFQSVIAPKGASKVDGLGKIAYGAQLTPAGETGPGAQVGWLNVNGRLLVLRLRFPPDNAPYAPADMIQKLVALAQLVDFASG